MLPSEVTHLRPLAFGSETSCLGGQLVQLLRATEALYPHVKWYVADVQTIGPSPTPRRESIPRLVGDTDALIRAARQVEQFESGVFVGVPHSLDRPVFRAGGLWTEDDDRADLGDGVVEIRAFDTSYWSIATAEPALAKGILERIRAMGDGLS
jgi:hypothetical protein